MNSWDFMFRAYRRGELVIEIGLRGTHSMEMEWEAGQHLLGTGHYDRITLSDMRPKWLRDLEIPRYREVVSREERN